MLQFQQYLFPAFFFTNDVMCRVHYDVIYHPFPINFQYLKTWRVDSPAVPVTKVAVPVEKAPISGGASLQARWMTRIDPFLAFGFSDSVSQKWNELERLAELHARGEAPPVGGAP